MKISAPISSDLTKSGYCAVITWLTIVKDRIFGPKTLNLVTSSNISHLADRTIPVYAEHVTVLSAPSLPT